MINDKIWKWDNHSTFVIYRKSSFLLHYCHQANNFIFAGDVPSLRTARRHVYARVLSVVSFMPCVNRVQMLQYCISAFAIVSKSKLTLLFGRVAQSRQIAKLLAFSQDVGVGTPPRAPTPLTPQASVPPPRFWGEGHTRWRERCWGVPIPTRRHILWYSLFILTLCRAAKMRRPTNLPSKLVRTPIRASSLYGSLPDPPPPRKMAWVELILWRMVTATSTEMAGPDIATTVIKLDIKLDFGAFLKSNLLNNCLENKGTSRCIAYRYNKFIYMSI